MQYPPRNKHRNPETLFGRIAVELGFITAKQLLECVREQGLSNPRKRIGQIMLEKGYLTQEQIEEILKVQKQNLEARTKHPEARLQDSIIGRLIVQLGYASEEQVNEALRIQALREERGIFCRLGEIVVEKGWMTAQQVIDVLKKQNKQLMACPFCKRRYNVVNYDPRLTYYCKYCKQELQLPHEIESPGADTTLFIDEENKK